MHISEIDYIANNGTSLLHKARPFTKIAFTVIMIFSVLVSDNPLKLSFIALLMFILFLSAKIPLNQVGHLVIYPVFFSLFFVLFIKAPLIPALTVVFKALCSAMIMLLLITTTSHADIFGIFSLFMPGLLLDIMFFTYRTIFILLDSFRTFFRNTKIRGGYNRYHIIPNIKNAAKIMGILLIRAYDMSNRMFSIYSLRGYNKGIKVKYEMFPVGTIDFSMIILSILIAIGAMIKWTL